MTTPDGFPGKSFRMATIGSGLSVCLNVALMTFKMLVAFSATDLDLEVVTGAFMTFCGNETVVPLELPTLIQF